MLVTLPFHFASTPTAPNISNDASTSTPISAIQLPALKTYVAPTNQISMYIYHDKVALPNLNVDVLTPESRLDVIYQVATSWLIAPKPGGFTWVHCPEEKKAYKTLARIMRYLTRTQPHISYFVYSKAELMVSNEALAGLDKNKLVTLPLRMTPSGSSGQHCVPVDGFKGLEPCAPASTDMSVFKTAGVKTVCHGWTDFFSIPRSLWASYIKWAELLDDAYLASEIMIATILNLVITEENPKTAVLECIGDATSKAELVLDVNAHACFKGYVAMKLATS
jgi:hypothetical protein